MRDAEAALLARELATLRHQLDHLTRQGADSSVLDAGTWQFDAQGIITRPYRVPYAALAITNRSAAATIVVESGVSRGQIPTLASVSGPGIFVLGPGQGELWNTSGYVVSIYGGNPGELVTLQVFARPQSPAWR